MGGVTLCGISKYLLEVVILCKLLLADFQALLCKTKNTDAAMQVSRHVKLLAITSLIASLE